LSAVGDNSVFHLPINPFLHVIARRCSLPEAISHLFGDCFGQRKSAPSQ
jgi:hypothetical protein